MQLKGLVKFFTAALILISLYQLSFTFVARNVESKARKQAVKAAHAANPEAGKEQLDSLAEVNYEAITDSLQGEVVYKIPLVKDFTYMDVKSQELNLGLDLQGGMNVTLEVSLDELVRSMSNNPKDARLSKAIDDANKAKANSQADFVTLFGQQFMQANPGAKLAYLFTKPSDKEITLNSTNEQVIAKIQKEAKDAIVRTHKVLLTRIDKFGVANPNVNLDANKGIITVELAGVRNPDRVRTYLQATASLEFYVVAKDAAVVEAFQKADAALESYLASGNKKIDTTAATVANDSAAVAVATPDSGAAAKDTSLASMMNNSNATAAADTNTKGKNPLLSLVAPVQGGGGELFFISKRDVKKFEEYMKLDVVKSKIPSKIKICIGVDQSTRKDPNGVLPVYALTTTVDGGARLDGSAIERAYADMDQLKGGWEIVMTMNNTGSNIWKKMTGENVGRQVAVVLDDRVYSAPNIISEISGGITSITGGFTAQQAQDLANILNTGKLPAPANIVQEQVVGPTLGAEAVDSGMNSLLISFIVIFLLMLVYYNTGGIVANISLVLNVLFTIGILAGLGATLTMPGIAGLVLGIGMAVDTNVIIFERIKEELAGGASYEEAVKKGYYNSLAPVLDGHVTILITSIILFIFGLGPVLGFATTQIISILLSLFCGILVSRLVTDIYMRRGRHFKYFTGLSKSIFRKAHFNFIGARKVAYGISIVVLLAGVASFFNGFNYGVEFDGGRSYTIKFEEKLNTEKVRDVLHNTFGEYPVVKTIGQDNHLNITTAYLIKKPGKEVEAEVATKLLEGLKAGNFIPATTTMQEFTTKYVQSSQTVLPTISDDLKMGAIEATILSLLAIFVYILLRFRKWQYSVGTIVALLHDVAVTLAVFSFFKGMVPFALEIDQHFIAAVLTVIGFSMNDTVIVFDRIREYFRKNPGEGKQSVINRAINDTLSRTIMTSLTVFLSVLILFIFGGEVTRGFAFAMLIGVITGTYSSIFVAAPVLVDMDRKDTLSAEVDKEARIEELKKMA
ncbi:MAG: protein translocase subunit SecDF [Flavipsychrobacter sp.]|nr:protein translocase subunit SecDF [Flavipsychrobacter sp.]